MKPAPISRRRAIVLGGLGAASLATGATGWFASSPVTPAPNYTSRKCWTAKADVSKSGSPPPPAYL